MRFLLLLSAFPVFGALAMVVAAVLVRRAEPELRRTGTVATGTIVGSRADATATGEEVFRPVVRFTTDRGRRVRAVGDISGRRPFATDTSVVVVYDPKRPQTVLVGPGRFRTYLVGAGVFVVIALVLLGAALAVG